MVPATATTTSPLARAFSRAVAEKIVVTHTTDARVLAVASVAGGAWADKPYHITLTGERPQDVNCDCPAGRNGRTCKHIAAGIFSRKYHVTAVRPAPATCPTCGGDLADPLHDAFC
jgi:hypothetical protein